MYSRDNRTKEKFNLCLVSTGCCSLSSWVTLAITLPGFQYCSFFIREMITLRIKQILFWSWPVPTGIFPNFFPIFVCSIGIILDSMHPSIKQKTWAGYWCEMVNHFMHNVAKMTKRSLKISRCLHHNILKYGHFLALFMTGFMATLWCFCLSSACILLCIFYSRFGWLWTNFCRSSWRQIPHSSPRPHRVFMQNENRLR